VSDDIKAWREELEQQRAALEQQRHTKVAVDINTIRQALQTLHKLRNCDVRLTRFEHKLLDQAIFILEGIA
jgi:hypothetical protein